MTAKTADNREATSARARSRCPCPTTSTPRSISSAASARPGPTRKDCPKNARASRESGVVCTIEVDPRWQQALPGVETCSHLIVLYWMDRARRDLVVQVAAHVPRPAGRPFRCARRCGPTRSRWPWSNCARSRATRSHVVGVDCLDSTPLLDIKPYFASTDSIPDARAAGHAERKARTQRINRSFVIAGLDAEAASMTDRSYRPMDGCPPRPCRPIHARVMTCGTALPGLRAGQPLVSESRPLSRFRVRNRNDPSSLMPHERRCCRESTMINHHLRLAVSALAAAFSQRAVFAQPPPTARAAFLSRLVFQQSSQPAPQATRLRSGRNRRRRRAAVDERFKRQVVSYTTNEAPGTIVIDTPNTFLYLVLGNGQAMRYGIGVGREGFTWAGTKTVDTKAEWPDWHPPAGDDRAPALSAALHGRRPRQPARRARHVSRRHASIASTAPTRRRPSASACRRAASASPTRTSPTSTTASRSAPRSWCCR